LQDPSSNSLRQAGGSPAPSPAAVGSRLISGDKPGAAASDIPYPRDARAAWQSPEEPSLLPQTLETARLSREDLFFQGQPTTLGALQILIGLLQISGGGILVAAPKFVEFPTTYWYLLAGGVLFFITGAATLITTANCTIPRMKVSTGMNLVSLLCSSLGICAFVVELTAGSRYAQVPQKSLLVPLLLCSILELGITSLTTFLGFWATFCYTWPVRSRRDRTGAPTPCPQSLD
ncbi:hypothetical protein GH733_007496, partial [Mirounga leonina]